MENDGTMDHYEKNICDMIYFILYYIFCSILYIILYYI